MHKHFLAVALVALVALDCLAMDVTGKVSFLTRRGQRPKAGESVVWLAPVKASGMPKVVPQTLVMTTRSKTILPHIMILPLGSSVSFPNDDAITHNLFSVSKPNDFDVGLYRRGTGKTMKFMQAGIVNVYCNVHPDMSAVIHVMATPYYAQANAQGMFTIANVVPGTYTLVAWNEVGGSVTSPIEVATSGIKGSVNLTIDSRSHRQGGHMNKEGKPYENPRSGDY